MPGFDIIGDIHGQADALDRLLDLLGYRLSDGVRRHPDGRRAVFLGDFIDRGPGIQRVLQTVSAMREAGTAFAVMGNHEMNAIHYQTWDAASGKWLRSHTDAHLKQFCETTRQLGGDLDFWIGRMKSLPVWLKLRDDEGVTLRFVHAAWHEKAMRRLFDEPIGGRLARFSGPFEAPVLTEAGILDFGRRRDPVTKETPFGFKMKERILTGPEIPLPEKLAYADNEGTIRRSVRIKWWQKPEDDTTLADMVMAGKAAREALIKSGGSLAFNELSLKKPFEPYPVEGLTFFGHYWLDPSETGPQTDRLACLDYSVARGGCLAAYRHESGQTAVSADQFVAVPAQIDRKESV